MSLFTKRRRLAREEKARKQNKLIESYNNVIASLELRMKIYEEIIKNYPDYGKLPKDVQLAIYKEYLNKHKKHQY